MFGRSHRNKDNEKKYDPEVNFIIISGTMKIQVFHLFHIALSCFTVYRAHLIFKWMPINNSVWSLMNNNLCILNIAYINPSILYKSILKNCWCHLELRKSKKLTTHSIFLTWFHWDAIIGMPCFSGHQHFGVTQGSCPTLAHRCIPDCKCPTQCKGGGSLRRRRVSLAWASPAPLPSSWGLLSCLSWPLCVSGLSMTLCTLYWGWYFSLAV